MTAKDDIRDLAAGQREIERQARVKYYQRHLYEFCVEILGYDKLSPTFHGPLLKRWDALDMRRWKGDLVDSLDLWPRDHIKTWCERARVVRYFLVDPAQTVTWWHAVEEMAQESVVAIGKMILTNKELRRLWPRDALPAINAKKFVQASGFSLRTNRIGDAPSMKAWGVGSEATGGHSRVGVMDDVIAFNDVVDNQMPAKRRWYQGTVGSVVRVSEGWKDGVGTRWDPEDIYADWLKSEYWDCVTRAAIETDGKPDYSGVPVYLTKEQIEKKRAELGPVMFALQMMNDPMTQDELAWKRDCEQRVSIKEANGPGHVVVLSDPAPARTGSADGRGEAYRKDGTKDDWATAVMKMRKNGDRLDTFLLQGWRSKDLDVDMGFDKVAQTAKDWKARAVAIEADGSVRNIYADKIKRSRQRVGARFAQVDLEASRRSQAKKSYFEDLSASNTAGEFFICDSVDPDFLETFLGQARRWKILPGGRIGLKYDDCANVVSMAFDPAIKKLAPNVHIMDTAFDPFSEEPIEQVSQRTRYCGA